MKARKFELFMCCLGNGVTVCNSAVREDNDLKIIAHISNAGNIKLRVDEDYIPVDDMNTIKKTAEEMKRKYMENFYKQSQMRQSMCDGECTIADHHGNIKGARTIAQKAANQLGETVYINEGEDIVEPVYPDMEKSDTYDKIVQQNVSESMNDDGFDWENYQYLCNCYTED